MRGIKIPFEVETTSSTDEGSGDVVPIPAEPVAGKVFVCALIMQTLVSAIASVKIFLIKYFFCEGQLSQKTAFDENDI